MNKTVKYQYGAHARQAIRYLIPKILFLRNELIMVTDNFFESP